jgi:PfaD family protein
MTTTLTPPAEPGVHTDAEDVYLSLARVEQPWLLVRGPRGLGATHQPRADAEVVAALGPLPAEQLGSAEFRAHHGVRYAYLAGAMAGGIASEELVIAMARAGFLAAFGAAGLLPERVDRALTRFAREIPDLPYAVNLIHSPSEEALEKGAVDAYLRHGVRCVEASAFMDLTRHIVRYRVAGLRPGPGGGVLAEHRVIAKVSRVEVAEKFMRPPPAALVRTLLADGEVTEEQARLAERVPMADDVTAEGDSGGHTDRRPLVSLLPCIVGVRDAVQATMNYPVRIRVGAAGGIGTPQAAAGAFAMGADYLVTGSVNQSCVESGTSRKAREMLGKAGPADCGMASAADMFELGVQLQVLKKGTMFPMRANQLYELYRSYDGLDSIPVAQRTKLEQQVFRRPIDEVWADTVAYFDCRDPAQLERAAGGPKRKMALVFRWYLGMASRWAAVGEADRGPDYQIWCGPAMGSFNDWARGSYLAAVENRHVADVGRQLMVGSAFTQRVHQLGLSGVRLPSGCRSYRPLPPTSGHAEGLV